MKWTTFIEIFTTAVDSQDSLTAIEKFTYLKGQLEVPAADCVQGFSLTSKNYEEAKHWRKGLVVLKLQYQPI